MRRIGGTEYKRRKTLRPLMVSNSIESKRFGLLNVDPSTNTDQHVHTYGITRAWSSNSSWPTSLAVCLSCCERVFAQFCCLHSSCTRSSLAHAQSFGRFHEDRATV